MFLNIFIIRERSSFPGSWFHELLLHKVEVSQIEVKNPRLLQDQPSFQMSDLKIIGPHKQPDLKVITQNLVNYLLLKSKPSAKKRHYNNQ